MIQIALFILILSCFVTGYKPGKFLTLIDKQRVCSWRINQVLLEFIQTEDPMLAPYIFSGRDLTFRQQFDKESEENAVFLPNGRISNPQIHLSEYSFMNEKYDSDYHLEFINGKYFYEYTPTKLKSIYAHTNEYPVFVFMVYNFEEFDFKNNDSMIVWEVDAKELLAFGGGTGYYFPLAKKSDNCTKITQDSILYFHPISGVSYELYKRYRKRFAAIKFENGAWWLNGLLLHIYPGISEMFFMFHPGTFNKDHWGRNTYQCFGNGMEYFSNGFKYELVIVTDNKGSHITAKKMKLELCDYDALSTSSEIFLGCRRNDLFSEPCDGEDIRMELLDSKLLCEVTNDSKLCYHAGIEKNGSFSLGSTTHGSNELYFERRDYGWFATTDDKREYKLIQLRGTKLIRFMPTDLY